MGDIELNTEDKLEYSFFPNSNGYIRFRVRASNDAHIALSTSAAAVDPMYEIFIGGWGNQKSVIRKNRTKPDVAEVPTPNILNGGEFRSFWIRWDNNTISCGCENNSQAFISFTDSEYIPISYVGVCTGWGANGSWIIHQGAPLGGFGGGGGGYGSTACNACWVAGSGGSVPSHAFVGGEDGNGEPLYVVRCNYEGCLIPGKLVSSHGTAYVPWGGAENAVGNYEVLCDFGGRWVSCSGGNIPPNALAAGQTEDGEPLYVGRVIHEGTLTIGKVQQSHSCCYIPFGGQEVNYPQFEILTS